MKKEPAISFLDFALENLSDDDYRQELGLRAMDRIANYLSLPKEEIVERMRKKLIKGSAEHGSPILPQKTIEQEIFYELDDFIFGWPLVEDYNVWVKELLSN
jgi:hypothetical protein